MTRSTQAATDPWGFGYQWSFGDTTSHGAGLSVMASEADYMTRSAKLRDVFAEMAGEHPGSECLGLVVYRGRREHVSELHPAPGSQSGGRPRRDFRRHPGAVGSSCRGSRQLCHFRGGRWHDLMPGKRSRHVQEIQRKRRSL